MQILKSQIDVSVNFVTELSTGQAIEARYVRRQQIYISAYLSSQTGCNHGCKFCHLTTTKQTKLRDVDFLEFTDQAKQILDYYKTQEKAEHINWNFMARGEPLANKLVVDNSLLTLHKLYTLSHKENLSCRINISTIMPKTLDKPLIEIFPLIHPTIYYSIYSVNDTFRSKWLPSAMPVLDALKSLKQYQDITSKLVVFHCAFIKGENDGNIEITHMMETIRSFGIQGKFNIVRYNPYSSSQGLETDDYSDIVKIIEQYMPVKIISRVGEDVHASCGMFIN